MVEKTYRGYVYGLTIIGYANSIEEFVKNQVGFCLINTHEVELINGEWEKVAR